MLYRIDETHVVYNNDRLENLDFYRISEDGEFVPIAFAEHMYSAKPKIHYYETTTEKEKEVVLEYISEIEPDYFD